ncbi:MAG: CopG family transcriptional regulator [Balneolaceae bacterium]|nr:MAG: CopG family transcriptional regulator [Balneolaceae bacterium]
MRTVRLTEEQERQLDYLARKKNASRSQVIKDALVAYYEQHATEQTAYEKGEALFGKYRSGESGRSQERKKRIRDKIRHKKDCRSARMKDENAIPGTDAGHDH